MLVIVVGVVLRVEDYCRFSDAEEMLGLRQRDLRKTVVLRRDSQVTKSPNDNLKSDQEQASTLVLEPYLNNGMLQFRQKDGKYVANCQYF